MNFACDVTQAAEPEDPAGGGEEELPPPGAVVDGDGLLLVADFELCGVPFGVARLAWVADGGMLTMAGDIKTAAPMVGGVPAFPGACVLPQAASAAIMQNPAERDSHLRGRPVTIRGLSPIPQPPFSVRC